MCRAACRTESRARTTAMSPMGAAQNGISVVVKFGVSVVETDLEGCFPPIHVGLHAWVGAVDPQPALPRRPRPGVGDVQTRLGTRPFDQCAGHVMEAHVRSCSRPKPLRRSID